MLFLGFLVEIQNKKDFGLAVGVALLARVELVTMWVGAIVSEEVLYFCPIASSPFFLRRLQ